MERRVKKKSVGEIEQEINLSLRKEIIKIVESRQGIKAVSLAMDDNILKILRKKNLDGSIITEAVQDLVNHHKIGEIEYVLPALDWKIKSFLVPAGTKSRLQGAAYELKD